MTDLVEIKYQVELADVSKKRIQDLDEEVNSFEICQFVVVRVYAGTEEQAGIPTIHDLRGVMELNKVRLMLLVPGSDKTMNLRGGTDSDLVSRQLKGSGGDLKGHTSPLIFTFSSSWNRGESVSGQIMKRSRSCRSRKGEKASGK